MSNNDFRTKVAIGNIGEEKFKWLFDNSELCLRLSVTEKHICYNGWHELIDVAGDRDMQNSNDVDFIIEYDCSGCRFFDEHEGSGHDTETVEVKTNLQTHEEGKTQNLLIETVSHVELYNTRKTHTAYDPMLRKDVTIRDGIGWYNKREKKANWYFFYNRIDGGVKASDEKIQKFLNDDSIPDGSALLTKWPVNYFIGIRGSHLKKIIDEGVKKGIYGEKQYTNKTGKWHKSKGYMIPVTDVIRGMAISTNADKLGGGDEIITGRWCNDKSVIVEFVLDSEQVAIKGNGKKFDKLYVPTEIIDESEKFKGTVKLNDMKFTLDGINGLMWQLACTNYNYGMGWNMSDIKDRVKCDKGLYFIDATDEMGVTMAGCEYFTSSYREKTEYPNFQYDVISTATPY